MKMENKHHNKVKIIYNSNCKFGRDVINIDIENTSFGALRLLQKELKKLAKSERINADIVQHHVSSAYADLLDKLSASLLEKLNQA